MSFMELFKNFCTGLVLIELFVLVSLIVMVFISDRLGDSAGQSDRTGRHTLCALTDKPCIYAQSGPDACDDCPAAQKYFYQEEQNGDTVRGIQDEGRTD